MIDGFDDWLLRNSIDRGRHNGIGGGLFILFDSSCGAIFDPIFGLLAVDWAVTWAAMGTLGEFPLRRVGLLDLVVVVGG